MPWQRLAGEWCMFIHTNSYCYYYCYLTRAAGPPTKEPDKAHGVQQAEKLNLKLQSAQKNPSQTQCQKEQEAGWNLP
jgi:hypothetical protein